MSRLYCSECFKKDLLIDQLKEENARLHQQLRHQQRSQSEGVFGSSTPSSKKPFKKVSATENQHKRGGARKGHRGNGRKSFTAETADEVIDVETPTRCPDCGRELHKTGFRQRSVLDVEPVKIKTVLYRLQERTCPHCKKKVHAKAPGVLAHSFYSNKLISYLATEHYLHRVPINHLAQRLGLSLGSVIGAFHRLANVLQKVPENLMKEYRRAVVKHADETSWRNDGRNGYAWLFATQQITLLLLRTTRSALVVREVLGTKQLPGCLVVDRYAGYNKSPCRIQYCYAHLLRAVQDIMTEFPNNQEVICFVNTVAPLLAKAMSLHSADISDNEYYRRAVKCKDAIIADMNSFALHPAIQKYQNIFRNNVHRLYHWADDRAVPADNGKAIPLV